jgi:hypothetical protein
MLPGVKLLAQKHNMDAKALDARLKAARDEHKKNKKRSEDIPRKNDVEAALKPITKHASKLHSLLKELDPMIQWNLDYLPPLQYDLSLLIKDLEKSPWKARTQYFQICLLNCPTLSVVLKK